VAWDLRVRYGCSGRLHVFFFLDRGGGVRGPGLGESVGRKIAEDVVGAGREEEEEEEERGERPPAVDGSDVSVGAISATEALLSILFDSPTCHVGLVADTPSTIS
jgi:hypothetical protein